MAQKTFKEFFSVMICSYVEQREGFLVWKFKIRSRFSGKFARFFMIRDWTYLWIIWMKSQIFLIIKFAKFFPVFLKCLSYFFPNISNFVQFWFHYLWQFFFNFLFLNESYFEIICFLIWILFYFFFIFLLICMRYIEEFSNIHSFIFNFYINFLRCLVTAHYAILPLNTQLTPIVVCWYKF